MEFAKSMSGHDSGQYYLIQKKDEKFVYLVNGDTKKWDAPKKKSKKHIQVVKTLPQEVKEVLTEQPTDITIKKAIKTYVRLIQKETESLQ